LASGDRKTPPGSKKALDDGPLDFLADTDEDAWAAAIDEWDSALDLPADVPPEQPDAVAAPSEQEGHADPLVNLMSGEMDLPEGEGQALGTLLGSPSAEEDSGPPATRAAPPPEPTDIGLSPEEVTASSDIEVEVSPTGWELAREEAKAIQEEPTPTVAAIVVDETAADAPRASALVVQEEPPPRVPEPPPESEDLADLDFDSLMDGLDELDAAAVAAPAPAPEKKPARARPISEEMLAALDQPELEEPPPLEVFDEIVPPTAPEPEDRIEAGEVLPRPAEPKPEDRGPLVIPDDLEQLVVEEPELQPPPIPDELQLKVERLELPEKIEPVVPLDAYRDQVIDLLRFEADLTDNAGRAAGMMLMAGAALEEAGKEEEAIDCHREALSHQPGNMSALRALRRIYTQRSEADHVAELLEEMAGRVGDRERLALQMTRAELLWSQTGDDAGARSLLEEDASRDIRGLMILADLAAATGDDEELATVVGALAQKVTDERTQHALQVELGRLLEVQDRLQDARAAYQKAGSSRAAQEGLVRVCPRLGDAAATAEALSASAVEPGLGSARRLRRAARLVANKGLEQSLDVLETLRRAAKMAGEDSLIVEDLAEAVRSRGDPAEALESFAKLAQVVPEATQRALALLEAGMIAEEQLSDQERAFDFYTRASDALPQSMAVQVLAAQLRIMSPDAEVRLEALRRLATAGQGSHRSARHLEAAMLLQSELSRGEEAAGELVEALEHDPANQVALAMLERLYRERGELDQLAAILDTAAEVSENPSQATDLHLRAALLYEGHLSDLEAAAARYRRALEQDAGRVAARLGLHRALAGLGRNDELAEAIAQTAMGTSNQLRAAALWTAHAELLLAPENDAPPGPGPSLAPDRRQDAEQSCRMAMEAVPGHPAAVQLLTLLDAQFERWSDIAELWSTTAEGMSSSSPRRKAMLMRLAALQEFALDDPSAAVGTYEEALAEPHPAPGALEGLIRVLRKAGQTDRLTNELERELAFTSDPAARFAVMMAAGELALRSGIDWSDAERRFTRALEEVPEHPVARTALERLYQSNMAWQQLSDLYLAELQSDPDSQSGAAQTAGRVFTYERLATLDRERGDTESARLSYESIAELAPGHVGARRYLQQVHHAAGRHDLLALNMQLEAEHAESEKDMAALWVELGRQLANHPVAADEDGVQLTEKAAYLKALERDPSCVFERRRLVDTALMSENKEELAEYYIGLADAVGDGIEAAVYLARAGELRDDLECYRRALEQLPEYLGAIYRLRDGALRTENWEAAYLASVAECRASNHGDHRTNAGLLAGEIAQEKLQDPERAASAFKQALEEAPDHRFAFHQLRGFLEQNARWEELTELLGNRAAVERSRARLIELHGSLARLHRDRLEDSETAKRHLRVLLKLDPEDRQALGELADLFEADEQWVEAANTLIRLAKLEQDSEVLRDLFLRLGRIYHEKAPDLKRGIVSFRKVVALDPDNTEALDRLSKLYVKDLDHSRALATTTQLLEKETEKEARVQILLRIAKIHEDGLKDSHQAAIAYRQALEINPTDLDAIGEVIGFFVRQGDQRSLMIHLDRSVATMRGLLRHDPFNPFPFKALFKIYGWRKHDDGRFCASQALEALGHAEASERAFVDSHVAGVGAPGTALGDPEHDELMFHPSIPGGFRQVFRILADQFAKYHAGDIRAYGAGRSDRISDVDHPVRRIGDALAKDFGLSGGYEVYILKDRPTALVVENTTPPAVLIGKGLLHEVTESEIQFILGRSLWMISRAMILPAHLKREVLELLVAGIVRQYQPDYQPTDVDFKALQQATKRANKVIPRKLKQDLMPFALECSGAGLDLRALGASVVHSSNRVGLLTCRSIFAGLSVLARMSGTIGLPVDAQGRVRALTENLEAAELLRFSVSDAYLDLRRAMHISIH
jgi:tetratricopeptide (TPR) repeat protein